MSEESTPQSEQPGEWRRRSRSFGEVAETYDAARLAYPDQLVDDILVFADLRGAPALEVGAGTGKAALAFAARGVPLTCIEPDPRMAELLKRKCAGAPVTVVAEEFETWQPDRRYGLLYSAQAWHWIAPELRWARAGEALERGGTIALFWTDWHVKDTALRAELTAAHERQHFAQRFPDEFVCSRTDGPDSWVRQELAAEDGFVDVEERTYTSAHEHSTGGFVDLLSSHSAYRIMPPGTREALFAEVTSLVDAQGGRVGLGATTRLFLARTGG
ncbi:class I SAM-dependent methyltransferase [Streptomyces morookaense]|uniref:Class I SAM-dependent methyltransferase n=1 Tax=Streptomyces morookaense TaxID=1970 RepID=A0A7Y7BAA8_STRMO|nr:class I SAM-dependent methyltransferase [Streptomyces morookaense]NVK81714.1 class I SAM-dependent methyltransferase [Streptomyces morookaense]GHF43598.1 methyltransferase type 11 [Streptomyces morookaense]